MHILGIEKYGGGFLYSLGGLLYSMGDFHVTWGIFI